MTIKEKIINAATNLFLSNGVKSVTMDEIATTMGISKRTIYENFANKKELIVACIEDMQTKHLEQAKEDAKNRENILQELFAVFARVDENFKKRGRLAQEIQRYYPEIFQNVTCKHNEKGMNELRDKLVRGVAQGIILPETNVDFAVFVVNETLLNILSRMDSSTIKDVPIDKAFMYVLTYFFRGISTDKGIKEIDELIKKNIKNNE